MVQVAAAVSHLWPLSLPKSILSIHLHTAAWNRCLTAAVLRTSVPFSSPLPCLPAAAPRTSVPFSSPLLSCIRCPKGQRLLIPNQSLQRALVSKHLTGVNSSRTSLLVHGPGFCTSSSVARKREGISSACSDSRHHEQAEDKEKKSAEITGPTKTVKIYCAKCSELLYKYRKGGKGALVKCYVERIAEDYTQGDMKCHECGSEFARARIIKGKQAHKIIGGKVIMRK